MATMTGVASHAYRPALGRGDDLFSRCLAGAAVAGVVFLLVVFLTPTAQQAIESLTPEPVRMARLVTGDEPPPPPAMVAPVPDAAPGTVGPGDTPQAPPGPRGGTGGRGGASGERVADARPTGGNPGPVTGAPAGSAGRQRAAEVAASLSGATAALSQSLAGLSSSLQAVSSSAATPGAPRASRVVAGGRSDAQLASVQSAYAGSAGATDVGGSAVQGSLVSIGTLSSVGAGGGGRGTGSGSGTGPGTGAGGGDGGTGAGWGGGTGDGTGTGGGSGGGTGSGGGGGGGGGGGAGPGVYRSNASLMAVVQKYAAGIQFCYGNELKRHEGLKGKLVVALTIAASGEVLQAAVVQNTLGSAALTACALSQIRDWKFPAIPAGVTTFQVPFVFTPPN